MPYRVGPEIPTDPTTVFKVCTKCKRRKSLDRFSRHASGKYGRHPRCKDCSREWARTYYTANRQKQKAVQLLYKYGISFEQYEEMLKRQDGKCAICFQECKSGRFLAVDHDHTTGRIRGLLCANCNRGIGLFDEDLARFKAAYKYLKNEQPVALT